MALDRGLPFRPPAIELLVSSPLVDAALDEADGATDPSLPVLARLEAVRAAWSCAPPDDAADATATRTVRNPPTSRPRSSRGPSPTPASAGFARAIAARRAALAELCRDDASLTLATAHGTKGLEFDHVAVIGLDAGRFPSRRSVTDSDEPGRALEEERRLAYVAWTRARRSLTLVYDPLAPSQFLLEAFSSEELGVVPAA